MAWANDEGYDRIFVEQLKNLASPGDLLLAISGSGNSPNILKAVDWANAHGLTTVGITGFARRQAQGPGPSQPARRRRRHGDRRVAPPGGLPLDHRRPLPPVLGEAVPAAAGAATATSLSPMHERDWLLGIEIGGTKLQLGLGPGDGTVLEILSDAGSTPRGARRRSCDQIREAYAVAPAIATALGRAQVRGVGDRFRRAGGRRRGVGPDVLPGRGLGRISRWPTGSASELGIAAVAIQNDADTAGLAEARFGAGVGSRRSST